MHDVPARLTLPDRFTRTFGRSSLCKATASAAPVLLQERARDERGRIAGNMHTLQSALLKLCCS